MKMGTLQDYLAEELNCSKRAAKRLLDDRRVYVNGRLCWMAKHQLQPKDRVEVKQVLQIDRPAVDVLIHQGAIAVVNKPAGILTTGNKSIINVLPDELKGYRPAHRLDRETSGCLILVSSDQAYATLKKQFHERAILKIYRTVCHGRLEKTEFTLAKPIDGQPAQSHVQLIRQGRLAAELEVTIATGRTHQIRRHLAGIRHPVVGDRQYGPKTIKEAELRDIPRLMLHAAVIGFMHPETGKSVRVKAPLPNDYKQVLKML